MPSQITIALNLIEQYHGDQMYGDKPYAFHLLGVQKYVKDRGGDENHQTVALLHDIIEDTGATRMTLREAGIHEHNVEAIWAVTHIPGETRLEYLERCSLNKRALEVKKCDTMFNLRQSFKENVSKRIIKYTKQLKYLEECK